ncbi:MAG TPA: prepilin-type N-terminal cleavage/methylation domain-containing protein, partial [Verrucomicrobiae bacterium]
MKRNAAQNAGFTLVEILTVIAIIGLLAAMVMSVIPAIIKHAKVRKAQLQMREIVGAIETYEANYSHYPISTAAQRAANPDFTYGGAFQSPTGPISVGTPVGGAVLANAEVMSVLLDKTSYPGTGG